MIDVLMTDTDRHVSLNIYFRSIIHHDIPAINDLFCVPIHRYLHREPDSGPICLYSKCDKSGNTIAFLEDFPGSGSQLPVHLFCMRHHLFSW